MLYCAGAGAGVNVLFTGIVRLFGVLMAILGMAIAKHMIDGTIDMTGRSPWSLLLVFIIAALFLGAEQPRND